ncbi:MAG TPA: MFS transporter [Chloroflexota bacterium]|nr:MFS transporter [Chloroflexota bacterium]
MRLLQRGSARRARQAPAGLAVGAGRGRGPWFYGWTVVAVAFLTVAVALGTRAAFGVLLVALVDAFGWGRGLTAGAIALNSLLWAASAAPLGALLDRWGPRRVFAGAAVLAGLGLVLAALAHEPWQLYLGMGVLAGIGFAPLQVNSQGVIIANWFVRRRGLAGGLVAAGVGVGTLVLAPFTQWVVGQAGWQAAFLMLAALLILGVAPLNAVLQRHRPEDCGLRPDGEREPAAPRPAGLPGRVAGPSVREALTRCRFWALAASFLLGAVPLQFLLAHGVAYLVDVGFSRELAATVLGLSGAGTIGAMLLWGYVADRWGGEWAYTAGSLALMSSIGLLYLVAPGREGLLALYAVLFALGFASRQGLHAFMAAALAQGRSLGALMGILATHVAVGSAIGPALGGWVFDHTGSYQPAFALALASAAVAVGCVWLAAPRRGSLVSPLAGPAVGQHHRTRAPTHVRHQAPPR